MQRAARVLPVSGVYQLRDVGMVLPRQQFHLAREARISGEHRELECDGQLLLLAHPDRTVDGAMRAAAGPALHAPGPHLGAREAGPGAARKSARAPSCASCQGQGATPFIREQPMTLQLLPHRCLSRHARLLFTRWWEAFRSLTADCRARRQRELRGESAHDHDGGKSHEGPALGRWLTQREGLVAQLAFHQRGELRRVLTIFFRRLE